MQSSLPTAPLNKAGYRSVPFSPCQQQAIQNRTTLIVEGFHWNSVLIVKMGRSKLLSSFSRPRKLGVLQSRTPKCILSACEKKHQRQNLEFLSIELAVIPDTVECPRYYSFL